MSIEAKFSQSRNDMHWSHWDAKDSFIRWAGYDDAFWWDNVSDSKQFTDKVGLVTGRTYRLDPTTDTVTIL